MKHIRFTEAELRLLLEGLIYLNETNKEVMDLIERVREEIANVKLESVYLQALKRV